MDDVAFDDELLDRSLALWRGLAKDAAPGVLYLFSSEDDEPEGRWIAYRRAPHPRLPACRTQWFDLQAFLTNRDLLRRLGYRLAPVPAARWRRNPTLSSGVGEQLTQRSWGRADIYQARPALLTHGHAPSRLNPEAREARPLDNRRREG